MKLNPTTVIRALHDVGGAAWFSGALLGAVAVNGASRDLKDPAERARLMANGWRRWTPVALGAMGTHLASGLGLAVATPGYVAGPRRLGAETAVKTVLTLAAVAGTAYSGVLGAQLTNHLTVPAAVGAVPNDRTPDEVAKIQKELRVIQWATPALTAAVIALGPIEARAKRW